MKNNKHINLSSFFEDLSGHYDRFDRGHDFLRSRLLSDLKPYSQMACGSIDNHARSAARKVSLAGYLSRFAAVAAVFVLAFGVAMFNPAGENSGLSVAQADSSVLQKVTNFTTIHFKMTAMGSELEMWWKKPNDYRMQFSDGTIITNNHDNYSCLDPKTGKIATRAGLTTAGPEMFMLAELGEIFPFGYSQTQNLIKTSEIVSSVDYVYKGEECLKIETVNKLNNDTLVYVIDKDHPMIYDITRTRNGKVLSHVEVFEIDEVMSDTIFIIK